MAVPMRTMVRPTARRSERPRSRCSAVGPPRQPVETGRRRCSSRRRCSCRLPSDLGMSSRQPPPSRVCRCGCREPSASSSSSSSMSSSSERPVQVMKTLSSVGGRPCSRWTRALSSSGVPSTTRRPAIEDREAVAEAVGLGEVVRRQHDRGVVVSRSSSMKVWTSSLLRGSRPGRGLVEQQQGGARQDGPGDGHLLLHAAAHLLERLAEPRLGRCPAGPGCARLRRAPRRPARPYRRAA